MRPSALSQALPSPAPPATPDPLPALAEHIRRQPGFPAALARYTEGMIRFRIEGPRHFNKLVAHDTRYRIAVLCCGLDARHRHADGPPVTASLLLDALNRTLAGSQSVVRTTLQMMLKIGLLERRADPHDRRIQIYTPTAALWAINRTWFTAMFGCLDLIAPEDRLLERLVADDALLTRVNLNIGDAYRAGETLTGRAPELACFFHREFGWPLLLLIVRSGIAGEPLPSLNAMSGLFGAPRAQLALIRSEAARLGYVAAVGRWEWRATARLMALNERWLSTFFAFILQLSRQPSALDRRTGR